MSANFNQFWKKHRNRVGLTYFILGLGVGIISSGLITMSPPSPVNGIRPSRALQPEENNGWKPVHIFYGDSQHIVSHSAITSEYFPKIRWYSQARQDEVVAALLRNKKNGYFIDLAANDPIKISNTYALETHFGWRGLCMEPNPMYWSGLSYRKCTTVAAVVGSERMQEVYFKFPNREGPKGGIVGKEFDNKEPSKFKEDKPRYTVPLLEIFQKFQTPPVIDYLSLDVEGAEELVMSSFPFDLYRFNIITLERPSEKLQEMLKNHGYQFERLLKRNSHDTLWIHKSMQDKLDVEAACKIDTDGFSYHEIEPTRKTQTPIVKDSYC